MIMQEKDFINEYIQWLKSKIYLSKINDYLEITTPFLDRHNDHLQIYIKQTEEGLELTDDGYIINDLIMSGCDISSPRRKNVMQTILNGLGVKMVDDALVVEARPDNFPQKKHALLQAMISVNDMFMLSQTRVSSVFLEDVEQFLEQHDVRFTSNIQFIGKSGFSHNFNFVIPASKVKPERLIRAINSPTKDNAQALLFAWNDVKEVRKRESTMMVFLNDYERNIKAEILSAFSQYDVKPILWTKRQDFVQELIA